MMKRLKQKFKVVCNCLWFFVDAPLYVKVVKYESPRSGAMLVSLFVWYCLALFFFGLFFHKFNNLSYPKWFSEIAKNPHIIIGKPFAYGLIFLSLFYLQATLRNLWDEEEIKKIFKG